MLPVLLLLGCTLASCSGEAGAEARPAGDSPAATAVGEQQSKEGSVMKISSRAFGDGEAIPSKYTCDGQDIIPSLVFEGIPEESSSLALIMDDPDVPPPGSGKVWDHWVIWNIPPTTTEIEEGASPEGVTGRNSWGRNDWGGPCPPDREHRYFFKLYALDTTLDLSPSSGKRDLQREMTGHVIASAELMGRYDRRR